jgi:hypothetical protein
MTQPIKKELTQDEKRSILRVLKELPDNDSVIPALMEKYGCSRTIIMGILIEDTIAGFTPQSEPDSSN